MTLSFSTHWPAKMPVGIAGAPNRFVEKIWKSMPSDIIDRYYDQYTPRLQKLNYPLTNNFDGLKPKIHTLRSDLKNRWSPGNDIHFVINNRTANRYQFALVMSCISVQEVLINPNGFFRVIVDGKRLCDYDIERLAVNDGFDSVKDFFHWFDQPFKGKIIHWTGLKY